MLQQNLFARHAVFSLRPVKGGLLGFATVRLPDNYPSTQPNGTMRMTATNIPAIEEEERTPGRF
jgi:hypothetical protein